MRGVELIGVSERNDTLRKVLGLKGIALFSGTIDLSEWMYNAETIGSAVANEEIQKLWTGSEYFRTVLANERLAPLAKNILIKMKHAYEDHTYEYDSVTFRHDREIIKNRIDSFHIKLTADAMFSDLELRIRNGTLFWFYSNYLEFEIQWIVANVAYLFGILVLGWLGIVKNIKGPLTKKGIIGSNGVATSEIKVYIQNGYVNTAFPVRPVE